MCRFAAALPRTKCARFRFELELARLTRLREPDARFVLLFLRRLPAFDEYRDGPRPHAP